MAGPGPHFVRLNGSLRQLCVVTAVLPMVAGRWLDSTSLLPLAFAVQYLGLPAERWFVFAPTRHS